MASKTDPLTNPHTARTINSAAKATKASEQGDTGLATQRIENPAEGEAATTEAVATEGEQAAAPAPAKPAKPRQTVPLMLMIPPSFKEHIEAAAKAANTTAGGFARSELAKALQYTLPVLVTRQRGKYAHITDPDQRKAAIAADQSKQRDDVKLLLEGVRTGKIDIASLRAQLASAGVATS